MFSVVPSRSVLLGSGQELVRAPVNIYLCNLS